jgi:mortality factor 4-like protein 1
MPPAKQAPPPFTKDEKVLCFHHELLYDAKILEVGQDEHGNVMYRIHYKGWKNTWDDWVLEDRIRKHTPDNLALAQELQSQFKTSQKPTKQVKKGTGKANGMESARGSEERGVAAATQGHRGPRRARDYELESVSSFIVSHFFTHVGCGSLRLRLSLGFGEITCVQTYQAGGTR